MENSIEYEIAGGQIASLAVAFRDAEKNGNVLRIVRKNVEEIGRKEVGVCFAEFVVEKVFFVVGNRTRKRSRRQLVDAGFGGREGVESEERVIGRQIFTIEANTFQIARIIREIEELITDGLLLLCRIALSIGRSNSGAVHIPDRRAFEVIPSEVHPEQLLFFLIRSTNRVENNKLQENGYKIKIP